MKTFSEMDLDPLLVRALKNANFVNATDVQEQVIPIAMQGSDVIVRAKTGTGKTLAFIVPIMQKGVPSKDPSALIIVPTRELALQIADVANRLRYRRNQNVVVAYGGASINVQIDRLRSGPEMVIGTPGRIIDLIGRGALNIDRIRFLVIDEADVMLDMGFIDDIEYILSKTPSSKQSMLFSATMPKEIVEVATRHMHSPKVITVGNEEELVVNTIKHLYTVTENRLKFAVLLAYINEYKPKKAIIFVQTQYAADVIHRELMNRGISAILMHGGLTQAKRERSLNEFRNGARFLIATNVVARGIDIRGISDIINFDLNEDARLYVHRVGRSARMNADGRAVTIINQNQANLIEDIEYLANIKMQRIYIDAAQFKDIRIFRRDYRSGAYGRQRFGRSQNREEIGRGFRGYRGYRRSAYRR